MNPTTATRKARKPTPEAQAMRRDFKIRPGDTIRPVLRHVSASGMSRTIGLLLIRADRKAPGGVRILDLSYRAAEVLGMTLDRGRQGVKISGGGMDMGFELVYLLGRALFPNGFKVTPKTTHRNGTPDGETDADGGYALRSEWV